MNTPSHSRSFLFFSLITLALIGCRSPAPASATEVKPVPPLEVALRQLMERHHIPGLSLGVARNDSTIYATGLGYAQLEDSIPATAATPYRIASLTKPLAATVLLQLRDEGRLRLDDTLKNFVPGYANFFGNVRSYILENEPALASLVENYDFTRDDITVRHHLTHTAEGVPGTAFKYNGFLYGTLSRVMEARTETAFEELLRERLFQPAGMSRTLASQESSDPANLLTELALPYRYDSAAYTRSPFPETNVNAGAGVVSTAEDLLRFDAALNRGALLSDRSRREAMAPTQLASGQLSPYGLSWFIENVDGEEIIWHYGWQPGAYSGLYIKAPSRGLTMVVLANSEGLSAPFFGEEKVLVNNPFARLLLDRFGPNKP